MSSPRPVRISRRPSAPAAVGDVRSTNGGVWVGNRAAERRAARLFGLFVLVLIAIYAVFLGLAESTRGLGTAPIAWGIFSLLAVVLAVWGWTITFGRTPRGAQRRDTEILVRERLGRIRRFPIAAARNARVVQHYASGIVGPDPTEVVEIMAADRSNRTYVVGDRFFEQLSG